MIPSTAKRQLCQHFIFLRVSSLINKDHQGIGTMCGFGAAINAAFGKNQLLTVHYRRWSVYIFRIYSLHGKTSQAKLFILLIISAEGCIISVCPSGIFALMVMYALYSWINLKSTPCCSVDCTNRITLIEYLLMGNNLRLNGQQRPSLWV